MFLLREILFCAPLIIYAGFRIRKLIPQNLFKMLFSIIYILLVLAFPFAEKLSHAPGMERANFVMTAGYFLLPLLLYLILFVIALDLALGVAQLARILSRETVKRRRFRQARLFLCGQWL
jgi:hypothetical protein